ncbi:MAG: type II/IV secretion system ATPase subunit [Candidatus Thermoplasmatota archaeon]|nr:type II/IV secretion system ATPase subunit [Candidatus Thermoplasmatota archaeon]
MPLFSPTNKKDKKPAKNLPAKKEERISEVPAVGKYEVLDEYNIIPQTVSVEISWNPASMESIYIAYEPVISVDEEVLLKKISKNMEQIVKSSKNLPDDLSQLTIEKIIDSYLKGRKYKLNRRTVDKVKYYIKRNYEGYGPLEPLVRDPMIEDVSCNGIGIPVFVEHKIHGSLKTNIVFDNEKDLDSYVVRLAQMCGKEVSMNEPIIDGTFPQGHRIQLTFGSEISTKGSAFTFRLFRESPFTPIELIKYGAATSELVTYLWFAVENLKSAIIAGVPGVGKTSTINAILMFIPSNTKVFSIEETREINIMHQNWVATSTRESIYSTANGDSKNPPIGMFELVKMAMRQRPTYIVLGEIRGRESYSLFQAISTGHTAYSTIHADSMETLVNRLESNPLNIPRVLIGALNIVIFNKFVRVGSRNMRKLMEIDEIVGNDQDTGEIMYNKVFSYDFGLNEQVFSGYSKILNEVRTTKKWTQSDMDLEFQKRKTLLDGMVKNNITDYTNITRIINIYYKDPETALKMASGI